MNHSIGALGALSCVLAIACTTSPPAGGAATAAPALASSPAASVAAATVPAVPPPSGSEDLVGKPAPDFSATAQDGSTVHLGALKGKSVVLYFYPKDETPGCTKEACSFRDAWASIAKTGAVLIGVSADTTDSHKSFAAHYNLPFLLVTDADGSVGRSYGVPFRGHHARQTFVIGPDGNVRKAYREVDVTVHAQQVLGDLTHPS
jgi:thioredoxin-dependent peroxiredoxin